jgi:hypothetical protein
VARPKAGQAGTAPKELVLVVDDSQSPSAASRSVRSLVSFAFTFVSEAQVVRKSSKKAQSAAPVHVSMWTDRLYEPGVISKPSEVLEIEPQEQGICTLHDLTLPSHR